MSATVLVKSSAERSAARAYLFLSGLTGVLELGVVLFAARSGRPVWNVVGLGLLYQVASLFVHPFTLAPRQYRILLVAGAAAGAVTLLAPMAIAPAVAFSSVGLQGIREEQLATVSVATLPKRLTRIVGFIGAAAFSAWFLLAIPLLVGLVACLRPAPAGRAARRPIGRPTPHELLMVVHQTHYFAYSYVLLFVLVGFHPASAAAAAGSFALGWVTYSLAPSLLGRLRPLSTLVTGHVLVTAILVIIALGVQHAVVVTAAWILGGFGGGTVFCIKVLAGRSDPPTKNMETWENVGHVSGAVVALLAVVLAPVSGAFIAAAAFAAATAVGAVAIERWGLWRP